jgi:L-threonylcarbamoyladenylate synthase
VTDRLAADRDGIARAAALLRQGGLVAFPTDTVYGIGCAAGDAAALDRLFLAKRRPREKRVPVLIASLAQAAALGLAVGPARAAAAAFWPGPLTIVLPGAEPTAVRVPDHPVALALIEAAGPLATSSANRSDEPEARDAPEVLVAFADSTLLDAVLDGGRAPGGVPSTVIDCTTDPPRLLRESAISRATLEARIGPVD